jgi:ABC-type branched-subunit amino acid transport system substrate-binding protein
MPLVRRTLAALLTLSLLAAACGDDADDSSDPGDTTTTADSGEPASSTPDDTTEPDDTTAPDTTEPGEPVGPPPETDGFDGETITLGYLTDQSGPLAIVGNSLLTGSQVYWEAVNAAGGIAGTYPVELAVGDTQDSGATTVQEYQRIKDDSLLFAQVLSTPPTQALLEFLEEDGILAVPGSLAGQWANEPLLLPNGTAYELEMVNMADWWINDSGLGSADQTPIA